MNNLKSTSPKFELMLREVVQDLREGKLEGFENTKAAFQSLVEQFLRELGQTADIAADESILNKIISTEDLNEICRVAKTPGSEYVIRKHIRCVMKCYLESIGSSPSFRIRDEINYGIQLGKIGLIVGLSTKRDARDRPALDPNLVVLSVLTFAIFVSLLVVLKPK